MRSSLAILVALLLNGALTSGAGAQQYVIWQNPLDIVPQTDDVHVGLGSPRPGAVLTFDGAPTRVIFLPLSLPDDVIIRGFTFCYRTSNSQTRVLTTRIIGMTTPEFNVGHYAETTDLDSTEPVCFVSMNPTTPANYVPDKSLTLEMVLNIQDISHTIEVGAVGIHVEPVGTSAPESEVSP